MRGLNESGRSNRFAVDLFRPLPARYDFAAEALSFGQNGRWRRRMIDHIVDASPRLICDVATGTAGVAIQLARRTQSNIVGLDVSEEMLRRGRANSLREGMETRIDFVIGSAERLPFGDAAFDALIFTYLLRYVPDPAATLVELARVVKPGGMVATLEFFVPPKLLWRSLWWFYTRAVLPSAGLLVGRGWFEVGRFLGPSISEHYRRYPIQLQERHWRAAGLDHFRYELMSLGGGVVMCGTKVDR
ncbi:MAG: demethylmenaquinone methyltransferase / 2-methoxy-6-polyprenyl,4-benzoquinol methylase [Actinomycetota bacterium]|nr:demethylmenaquinone methyltransferase / 2-methoxy-6-polyprenyl,4-benzoquinol methylase [Actinomycetota bacterium]